MPAYTSDNGKQGARRQLYVAIGFAILALAISLLPDPAQQGIAGLVRTSLLRPFLLTQEVLSESRMRAAEATDLQARVDSLQGVLLGERVAREENRKLRELLHLSERIGPNFAAVTVVRAGTAGSESMFRIDRGARDGVTGNAPVVVGEGLVGVIRDVSSSSATGIDWTHPDFRASAMTEDGLHYGIVEPVRGAFREEDRLRLSGVPYHTSLAAGTLVVTSGLGGVFPRWIPIGIVAEVAEAEAGWHRRYWIQPLVRPGAVTHALVGLDEMLETVLDLSSVWHSSPSDSPAGRRDEEGESGGREPDR
jgi:rod shape-determining protein MreC